METEQAEVQDEVITPDQVRDDIPAADKDIKGILSNALNAETKEAVIDAPSTDEVAEKEQPVTQPAPFLELMLPNGEKLPITSEDDFLKLLESNRVLKDGWLRQSDYTRKTQEFARQRDEYEQSRKEEEKSWGTAKPDAQSFQALQSVWNVYNSGEPLIQDAIQKFVSDIHLIAKGKEPVGPIKDMVFGSQSPSTPSNPETQSLKSEIAQLKRELQGFKSQTDQDRQAALHKQQEAERMEAEKGVDSWLTSKEKSGVKVGQEELYVMADLMSVLGQDGKPKLTLDEAHTMSLAKLGKLQGAVAKQVLSGSKQAKKSSPLAPSSKASSDAEPESHDIKGILRQGLKTLNQD
jgi:hypothetical protein